MADNNIDLVLKYENWFNKKTANVAAPMRTMQRRTMNTAISIVGYIRDIPFSQLSSTIYFFCRDINVETFTRRYEAQLELAGADADKFIKNLHKFFNETAIYIKKNDLYSKFFEFISLCDRLQSETQEFLPPQETVVEAYQSLLLQQLEYLRPNKFDFKEVLCGQSTSGELITLPDIYHDFDAVTLAITEEIQRTAAKMTAPRTYEDKLISLYQKNGYQEVKSIDDIQLVTNKDIYYTYHHSIMLPYINEYTYDMLPGLDEIFSGKASLLFSLCSAGSTTSDILKEKLRTRKRTLPANGIIFKFDLFDLAVEGVRPFGLVQLKLKEVFYDDKVVLLYKLLTTDGAMCGYYDIVEGFISTVLYKSSAMQIRETIQSLILYLYATQVLRGGSDLLQDFNDNFWYATPADAPVTIKKPINVQVFGRGGKPENTWKPTIVSGLRKNSDSYEDNSRYIQGFIRKLGKNQHPSEDAIERAKAMGYDLDDDETYVQPFVKKVWSLKSKNP